MKISIILSTYNRCKPLTNTLQSLCKQEVDDSFDYEILVIDNNSKDQTKETVGSFAKTNSKIKYIFEPRQGISHARNTGVDQATGTIIAFIDDDVIVDNKWLMNVAICFKTFQCDGAGGRVLPIFAPQTPNWIKENPGKLAGAVVIHDYGPETIRLNTSMYPFIGANFIFTKEMFIKYGYFRTDLGPPNGTVGEDTEFVERLIQNEKNLYYCGQALIEHPVDPKRLSLRHMAIWHIALGKYDAFREIKTGKKFIYYFGIPRYLFKSLLYDFLSMPFRCFDKMSFMNTWRGFFRGIGMIQGYTIFNHKDN